MEGGGGGGELKEGCAGRFGDPGCSEQGCPAMSSRRESWRVAAWSEPATRVTGSGPSPVCPRERVRESLAAGTCLASGPCCPLAL